jgi:hypothetical protein
MVSIVQATELNDVQVAVKVDGVTRQLHALLRRSGGYVPANSNGVGKSCLLGGEIKAEKVGSGERAEERS